MSPLMALAAPSEPLRLGQAAPEWQVGSWSDGRAHKLADDRGKVIVLYFWGTDFWQSVGALPAIGKLAAKFEPRGVVFRAIHRPDGDEKSTAGRSPESARSQAKRRSSSRSTRCGSNVTPAA